MHVLQWIAIEANDEDEAVANVTSGLEAEMGSGENYLSWYDWFIVGGGRWNTAEDDGIMSAYTPKTNMVISYDKDPNGFRGQVKKCISDRIGIYNEYYEEIKDKDVMAMFQNYGGVMSYSLETYPLRSLIRFLDGEWNYNSCFYDLITDSTNAGHLLSKLDSHQAESPEKVSGFFLVPVDFHF